MIANLIHSLVRRFCLDMILQIVPDNNVDLVMRLRYKTDLRNADDQRLTSLSWAVYTASEDVFEFLLMDAGHDEDELSRVRLNGPYRRA